MINEIQAIRETIERAFDPARICPEERFTEQSPCGRYQLQVDVYTTAEFPHYDEIAVAVVRSTQTGEVIATIKRNDSRWFHAWVTRNNHEYLLCSEDLEGQTVVDLTDRRVEGFSSKDNGFIWIEFYPSPDKTMLAIVGCYWACPFQVAVYDFSNPLKLPLPLIAQFDLPRNDAKFREWISAGSFSIIENDGTLHVLELPRKPAGQQHCT